MFSVKNMVGVHISTGSALATICISSSSDNSLREDESSLIIQRCFVESSTPDLKGKYLLSPIEKNSIWVLMLGWVLVVWCYVVNTSSSSRIFRRAILSIIGGPSLVPTGSLTVLYVSIIKTAIIDMINDSMQWSFADINFLSSIKALPVMREYRTTGWCCAEMLAAFIGSTVVWAPNDLGKACFHLR